MSLRQKKYVVFTVMLGVPCLLCLLLLGLEKAGRDIPGALEAAAILTVVAGAALHGLWMRCPHCGTYLDRNTGPYCQHCGKAIDWDAKPGKE